MITVIYTHKSKKVGLQLDPERPVSHLMERLEEITDVPVGNMKGNIEFISIKLKCSSYFRRQNNLEHSVDADRTDGAEERVKGDDAREEVEPGRGRAHPGSEAIARRVRNETGEAGRPQESSGEL